ncbi:Tryptophan synthase alpha chain [Rhodococcus sp. AW25M09]|uniref:tryptophan synthase subunit alpha n=1 Tax=Rhodococcus sp. AW25M09 TaxID=1268303 RepID=UPI0002AD1122|nr:tryptophan synthase subunit alpha [Rhodococcus sp. AW25M09]CCQ16256.1 Tryptophan synthase alpha chain [Rhodococcus sp. AW25M09]
MSNNDSRLSGTFAQCRAEGRAALVGYLPAGFPTVPRSIEVVETMVDAGCDIIEVGIPYSDPVMDGPTIQAAADVARRSGARVKDVFSVTEKVAAAGGKAVVMTYWNLVLKYGIENFARDLAGAGGLGIITPDLIPDEAQEWIEVSKAYDLDRTFLVAPSSTEERLVSTVEVSSGFVYAASTMGVTGARDAVSSMAPALCARIREHSDIPIGVGLGVRSGAQAAEIARYADAVIVGSALVSAVDNGLDAVRQLTTELAAGVRSANVAS